MKTKKGFTLVELLAVIVILGILITLAIPSVVGILNQSRKHLFTDYVAKVAKDANTIYQADVEAGTVSPYTCVIYSISDDLDLAETGDYRGWVLVQPNGESEDYYITLFTKKYMVTNLNYSENTGKVSKYVVKYNSSNEDLTYDSLCENAENCTSCDVSKNAKKVKLISSGGSDEKSSVSVADPTKIKDEDAYLMTGNNIKSTWIKLVENANGSYTDDSIVNILHSDTAAPSDAETADISDSSISNNSVITWFDKSSSTIYFYSEARTIYANQDFGSTFYRMGKLLKVDTSYIDTKYVTSFFGLFWECSSIQSLDLSSWDVSNGENFNAMFSYTNALQNLNITGWEVSSKASNLATMFYVSNISSLDLSEWDFSGVVTTYAMFASDSKLTSIKFPSTVDFSNVTDFRTMFLNSSSLTNISVDSWVVEKPNSFAYMFYGCKHLTSLDLSDWNVGTAEQFGHMFEGCESLKSLNISSWKTSSALDMTNMFNGCTLLEEIDVSKFDTSHVTNMQAMFMGCRVLTSLDLSSFDTSSVTNMRAMFASAASDKPMKLMEINGLKYWDTSNVTNMQEMFYMCSNLETLDISGWDTSKVVYMFRMFAGNDDKSSDNMKLKKIYVGKGWSTESLNPNAWTEYSGSPSNGTEMFFACTSLSGDTVSYGKGEYWDHNAANYGSTGLLTLKV